MFWLRIKKNNFQLHTVCGGLYYLTLFLGTSTIYVHTYASNTDNYPTRNSGSERVISMIVCDQTRVGTHNSTIAVSRSYIVFML